MLITKSQGLYAAKLGILKVILHKKAFLICICLDFWGIWVT